MAKTDLADLRLLNLFRRKVLEIIICGGGGGGSGRSFSGPNTTTDLPETPLSSKLKQSNHSDRLSDLLKADSLICEMSEKENVRRKEMFLEEVKNVVRKLEVEASRKAAVSEVRKLAKDNMEAREMLAMVGAIPPLVGFVGFDDSDLMVNSLYALLNLSVGNDLNKAAIVKAGVVHKMMKLVKSGCSSEVSEAVVANFLALSALDSNKPIIGASGATEFLVKTLKTSKPGTQLRFDTVKSLYNLSICDMNVGYVVESGLVDFIFQVIGDMKISEKLLAIVSNTVAFAEGRRAVSKVPEWIQILVDVLNWCDSPECQERAAYILMIMAYKAQHDRSTMIESGIVSALLELTLMGSALAQNRASRILEILRVDRGKQISEGFVHCNSNSSMSSSFCENEEETGNLSEERKAVIELVQQSLQYNMLRIAKRANLPQEFVPSNRLLSVARSSLPTTSKSLPF